MKLTIGIKALNEERYIENALRSALAAVEPFDGEVILADSGSTDRTLEIATRYPVRIAQLTNPADRSCGAGAQLAFQFARGEYFYMLDGDMVLDPDFVRAAVRYLDDHPEVAGVGGRVVEMNTEGQGFRIRANTVAADSNWLPGVVDRLDCGGLYRSDAVRGVGYFADRNLHAFEEFELAARLQARGWTLVRIDHHAVDHNGHRTGGYRLLWRRIRSGYAGAPGEVLRGAIGQPHLRVVLRRMNHVRHGMAVVAWWLLLVAALVVPADLAWRALALVLLVGAPIGFLSWRRGSMELGIYSLAAWNVSAWGLLSGFFRGRRAPTAPLPAAEISQRPAEAPAA